MINIKLQTGMKANRDVKFQLNCRSDIEDLLNACIKTER